MTQALICTLLKIACGPERTRARLILLNECEQQVKILPGLSGSWHAKSVNAKRRGIFVPRLL